MQHLNADPDFVQSQAAAITTAAGQIQDASRKLFGLGYGEFESKAVDAFQTNVQQLASVLDDAWTRYSDTGQALAGYAPVLRQVQQETDAAIGGMAHTDLDGATRQADEADFHAVTQSINPAASDSDRDEANLASQRAKAHLEAQQAAVHAAQSQYDNAMADLHNAAAATAAQIENGIEASHLNDTFWDHFQQVMDDIHKFFKKALAVLDRVLNDLSTWLAVAGLACIALAAIPGLEWMAIPGELLETASTIASVLDLSVQLLQFIEGDISYGKLISTALVTAVTLVLTPVGGKVTGTGLLKLMEKAPKLADKIPIVTIFDLGKEGINFSIGLSLQNLAGAKALTKFFDDAFQPPTSITASLQLSEWVSGVTSRDVDLLTPDFSHINVLDIVNRSSAGAPDASPARGAVLVSSVT